MGYFSNGTEGDCYREQYCSRCVHDANLDCPIWNLHLTHNQSECNNPHSFLHVLIPRSKDGLYNAECRFFTPMQYDLVTTALTADAVQQEDR